MKECDWSSDVCSSDLLNSSPSSRRITTLYTAAKYSARIAAEIHDHVAMPAPRARIALPRYRGFRVYAYGPVTVRTSCLCKYPAATARIHKPANPTTAPIATDSGVGLANQSTKTASKYPRRTRHRAKTAAASLMRQHAPNAGRASLRPLKCAAAIRPALFRVYTWSQRPPSAKQFQSVDKGHYEPDRSGQRSPQRARPTRPPDEEGRCLQQPPQSNFSIAPSTVPGCR